MKITMLVLDLETEICPSITESQKGELKIDIIYSPR